MLIENKAMNGNSAEKRVFLSRGWNHEGFITACC